MPPNYLAIIELQRFVLHLPLHTSEHTVCANKPAASHTACTCPQGLAGPSTLCFVLSCLCMCWLHTSATTRLAAGGRVATKVSLRGAIFARAIHRHMTCDPNPNTMCPSDATGLADFCCSLVNSS